MRRPNVLLLYTDQQRWDTIGAGGNSLIHTPNLDSLSARGALFNNSYVNCPTCMPSRMSTLSGRYPASLHIKCNGTEMPPEIPCVQNVLNQYGYHTASIGKLHFKNHASTFRDHRDPHPSYGFRTLILSDEPGCYDDAYIKWVAEHDPEQIDNCRVDTSAACPGEPVRRRPRRTCEPYVFDGPEELTHTAFVAEETCGFLQRQGVEPFFCIAGFYAPHPPLNPPQRFVDMYDPASMPLPKRNDGENLEDISDGQWRKTRAYYYALISHLDDQVGRIMQTLEQEGLADNTLVIFTSDHGEHLGDHGWIGKGHAYDSSARVPLIAAFPGQIPEGSQYNEIVESVDLVPTILDWCGVQQPPFIQGRSFRPLLAGGSYQPRPSAFIELSRPPGSGYMGSPMFPKWWTSELTFKAVRTDRLLYIRWADGRENLYDTEADPDQLTDLSARTDHRTDLLAMRDELMSRWFESDYLLPRTGHY